MRRKIIYLVIIAFCFPLSTRADDASKMAKIHELFKVSKMDQLSAQSMRLAENQVKAGMVRQMFGVKLNADQQEELNHLSGKLMKILSSALNWDALEPEYAKLYAAAYTEQQIDDLLAFYKSPTGQVMIEKMPVLMQEANAVVQKRMADAMPQIQKLIKDYMTQAVSNAQKAKPNTTNSN